MRCFKGMLVVGAGSAAMFAAGAATADANVDNAALQAEIDALRAEVAQLKGDHWLTDQRAEEIRGLVNDVLADADTRASLLQGGMTAGYDNGFFIGTPDGNFNLKMNGLIQFRFVYNNREAQDENVWGFENTRTRLSFGGNVFDPSWSYYIRGNFARDGGSFGLNEAWIAHDCGNGWTAYMGQFRLPVIREWLVDEQDQLLVERSNVAYENWASSYTQGIMVNYTGEQFRFTAALTDGDRMQNSSWSSQTEEYSFAGRGEILFSGTWDQFDDFTSPPGSEQGFLGGFGFLYQNEDYGNSSVNEDEILVLTGDLSYEADGWNLFGAVYWMSRDDDGSTDVDEIGFVVQGGLYFNEDWEGFIRYEYYDFDLSGYEELSLLTFGVNRYFNPNVKWTTDLGFGIDEVESANSQTGWRSDGSGDDGQIVFRTQLTLEF